MIVEGSSNGRTQDFDSWYRGSSPCPSANNICGYGVEATRDLAKV